MTDRSGNFGNFGNRARQRRLAGGATDARPPGGGGRRPAGGSDPRRTGGDGHTPDEDVHTPGGVRLQKVLAQAGIGSRRACEELIEAGRVEVDGARVRSQGLRVDPATAVIRVDGMRIATDVGAVYLALNKPRGVVATMADPEGRPCLGDYVKDRRERLFHVGRLDTDTEGLILLTNDGELAHRLAHPSYGVPKTYLAQVPGPIPRGLGRLLRDGVDLEDGPVRVDSFRAVSSAAGRVMVEVVLHEGRNHIVRRMLAAAGHPVERLVRTRLGPVALGDLRAGRMRPLTRQELGDLYAAAGL